MDRDLDSIQQARDLVNRAYAAQSQFAQATQAQVDGVIEALGAATERAAEPLARLAVDETAMGRFEDKILKNRFSAVDVRRYILPLKTCGVIREIPDARVKGRAVPMGGVAALTPTTNPTPTAIYKALIALKARNSIVFSPHPRATKCVVETVAVMREALKASGEPEDLILCLTSPTLEATNELMRHRHTAVILATGGAAPVRGAAHSGETPARGGAEDRPPTHTAPAPSPTS